MHSPMTVFSAAAASEARAAAELPIGCRPLGAASFQAPAAAAAAAAAAAKTAVVPAVFRYTFSSNFGIAEEVRTFRLSDSKQVSGTLAALAEGRFPTSCPGSRRNPYRKSWQSQLVAYKFDDYRRWKDSGGKPGALAAYALGGEEILYKNCFLIINRTAARPQESRAHTDPHDTSSRKRVAPGTAHGVPKPNKFQKRATEAAAAAAPAAGVSLPGLCSRSLTSGWDQNAMRIHASPTCIPDAALTAAVAIEQAELAKAVSPTVKQEHY
jgi:hypothetical protein